MAPVQAVPKQTKRPIQLDAESATWKQVLTKLCDAANLSLDHHAVLPETTVTLKSKPQSLDHTISMLNRKLLRHNVLLIVDDGQLVTWDTKTKRPIVFVPRVEPPQLKSLGRYQLRTMSFKLEKVDPRQLIEDASELMGSEPFGSIIPLRTVNRVDVTALVGTLQRIRSLVDEAEGRKSAETQTRVERSRPRATRSENRSWTTSGGPSRRNTPLISYLQRSQVRQMLGVTAEQNERISEAAKQSRLTSNDMQEFLNDMRDASSDEREAMRQDFTQRSAKLRQEAGVSAFKVLNPDQQKGFAEWYVRTVGGAALEIPLIVEQLELSDDELKRLRDLVASQTENTKAANWSERSKLRGEHTKKFVEALNAMQKEASESRSQ